MSIPDNILHNLHSHVDLALGINNAYARIGIPTPKDELEDQITQIVKTHLTPLEAVNRENAEIKVKEIENSNRKFKFLFACLSIMSIGIVVKCRMLACAVTIASLCLLTLSKFIN